MSESAPDPGGLQGAAHIPGISALFSKGDKGDKGDKGAAVESPLNALAEAQVARLIAGVSLR